MSSIPEHIGPYEVRQEIGRGGMGVVYLARDTRLDRDVAIKALAPEMAQDTDRLARFTREARLIAQLNHPNIAQVYHLLVHEGRTHLVLEYVPGRSLAAMIDGDGALDPQTALALCAQVARAVHAAHARGIIHRDLKPANVRVRADGTAKVLDFGIARRARARKTDTGDRPAAPEGDDPAPRPTMMVGTPGYMAPEQARGQPVDTRADIFSFGCILYECLTGEHTFPGATTTDLVTAPLTIEPDWTKLPDTLPPQVLPLLRDCLAKDVDKRLAAIDDAGVALDAALDRHPTPSTRDLPIADIPNNLPQPATSFIGRGEQLQELALLLSGARLLTLTGAGGCGKTRLSLVLARRVLGRFPNGVYVAELAPTSNPDFVPGAVAAALGVKDQVNRTTTQALGEHLADGNFLLILDNCEHVLDAVSALTGELLRAAPGLRIVATSREALRVPGEHVWRVPSLTLPPSDELDEVASAEATTLFVDRARSLRPTFTLSSSNAAAITRICRRLDGIPLALELAAARTRILTPQEIDERLDDRFRLLAGDARGVAERHRTLRAAVDWSYQTLSHGEKRMLRALSVFAGGWTLDAAVAVCGPGGQVEDGTDLDDLAVLDLLTHLVDKSLAMAEDTPSESRYRMLETVRQYTAERLQEADEALGACDRHLDFYLALAEEAEPQLTGASQATWLERLETEHENLLTALDRGETATDGPVKALQLCRAVMRLWLVHGHYKRGLEACATALARPGAQQRSAARAGALYTAGVMVQSLGDYEHATELASEALDIHREHDDRKGMALSLNSLGNLAYWQGNLAQAQRLHEESLAINRELGGKRGIAASLNNLANVAIDCGSLVEARRLYEEALEINRQIGNPTAQSINLNNLGLIRFWQGDVVGARLHEESLAIRRDLGDRHGIAESLNNLGKAARSEGDLARARRLHEEGLVMRRDLGEKLGITDSLDDAALLAARLEEHERAARLLGAAERLRERMGAPRPLLEQQELDAGLAATRAALGEAGFTDAVRGGKSLSLDDTVAEALEWLRSSRAEAASPTRLAPGAGRSTEDDNSGQALSDG
ncbi:MAG: protein kinase domain-containing protein [Planctomycetota bacterium]|jgi:non-specific serine/threonine protein kinase